MLIVSVLFKDFFNEMCYLIVLSYVVYICDYVFVYVYVYFYVYMLFSKSYFIVLKE